MLSRCVCRVHVEKCISRWIQTLESFVPRKTILFLSPISAREKILTIETCTESEIVFLWGVKPKCCCCWCFAIWSALPIYDDFIWAINHVRRNYRIYSTWCISLSLIEMDETKNLIIFLAIGRNWCHILYELHTKCRYDTQLDLNSVQI